MAHGPFDFAFGILGSGFCTFPLKERPMVLKNPKKETKGGVTF